MVEFSPDSKEGLNGIFIRSGLHHLVCVVSYIWGVAQPECGTTSSLVAPSGSRGADP